MNTREQREENKKVAMQKRLERVEIVKKIMSHCQAFIDAEVALLDATNNEDKATLHDKKVGEKHELLYLFTQFKNII